jgi:hypothetical protein
MKKFPKWKKTGSCSMISTDKRSTRGTPLGKKGKNFQDFMSGVDGFEPGAEAYVYTVVLKRQRDDTRWYYVGETKSSVSGLKSRFTKHVRGEMLTTVKRNGIEVSGGQLSDNIDVDHSYVTIGVERAEPVTVDDSRLLKARVAEREREVSYEIAIEKDTTRVLGGT